MRRHFAVLPVVVLALACGSAPPVPSPVALLATAAPGPSAATSATPAPPARSASPSRRVHLPGVTRASFVGTPLDYASLPLMEPISRCRARADGTSSAPCTQRSFRMFRASVSPTCRAGQTSYPHDEWVFTGRELDASVATRSVVRVGRRTLPLRSLVAGHFEDPGSALANLGDAARSSTFDWTTADFANAATRTDGASLHVARTDGVFEETRAGSSSFNATATVEFAVEAAPLVPGEVFAYRACTENCGGPLGDPNRVEELTVIAPAAGWVGGSDGVVDASLGEPQPFTVVSTTVRVGSSATVLVDYPARNPTKHEVFGPPGVVTSAAMLDVVFPAGDAPELTLYIGSFDRPVTTARSAPTRDPSDDCYDPPPIRPFGIRY